MRCLEGDEEEGVETLNGRVQRYAGSLRGGVEEERMRGQVRGQGRKGLGFGGLLLGSNRQSDGYCCLLPPPSLLS